MIKTGKKKKKTTKIPAGAPSTVTSRRSRQGLGCYHGIGRLREARAQKRERDRQRDGNRDESQKSISRSKSTRIHTQQAPAPEIVKIKIIKKPLATGSAIFSCSKNDREIIEMKTYSMRIGGVAGGRVV